MKLDQIETLAHRIPDSRLAAEFVRLMLEGDRLAMQAGVARTQAWQIYRRFTKAKQGVPA